MNRELKNFLDSKRMEERTKETINCYRVYLEEFLSFLNNKSVKEITIQDVYNYLYNFVRNKNRKASTVQQIKRILKVFLKYYRRDDLKIVVGKIPKRELNIPSQHKIKSILEKIPTKNIKDLRDKAICEFIYGTGVRRGELVKLKRNNLKFPFNLVNLISEKTREPRITLLPSETIKWVKKYWNRRKDSSEYVFVDDKGKKFTTYKIYYIVKKRMNMKPHDLRHSFATHLMDNGASPLLIRDFLGHKNLESLKIYMHPTSKTWENALKAHPRQI